MYFSLWDLMKQAFIYFLFHLIVPNLGQDTKDKYEGYPPISKIIFLLLDSLLPPGLAP